MGKMDCWELGQYWGWVWVGSIFPSVEVWAGEALVFWKELGLEEGECLQVGLGLGSHEGPQGERMMLTLDWKVVVRLLGEKMILTPCLKVEVTILTLDLWMGVVLRLI